MSHLAKPFTITNAAIQSEDLNQMLEELYRSVQDLSELPVVTAAVVPVQGIIRPFGQDGDDSETDTATNPPMRARPSFTTGSVIFAGPSDILAQNNANFFWDNTNILLRVPTLVGGSAVGAILSLQSTTGNGTLGFSGASTKILGGNNGATEIARFYSQSANDPAILSIGPNTSAGLGSGGNQIRVTNDVAGRSGGIETSTSDTASGTDCGYFDVGSLGCPATEKRAGAIHGFLEASAAVNVTGSLRFYTTNVGVITEGLRITQTGETQFNILAKLKSPATAQLTFTNAAASSGFGVQMGTADTMIVANQAQSAYGTVDALQYKLSASLGLTATALTFPARAVITSPTNAQLTITNNALTSGFGLQASTADTMIVANQAQSAYGIVDALQYKVKSFAFANTNSSPADPTGTASTTGVMMGLAGSITTRTGIVFITMTGNGKSDTINDGWKTQIRYGTGTAPTNGAVLTGTATGTLATETADLAAAALNPFSLSAVVTGLTQNTAYWLDVSLAAITGGTAAITNVNIAAFDLP